MIIVIEHLEDKFTKWVYLEYKHISTMLKDKLMITNLKKEEAKQLKKFVKTEVLSAIQLFKNKPVIVLDPEAKENLKPEDRALSDIVIIGGIMGDHPPKKRTGKLLTRKLSKPIPRNIGEAQYSVDGAAMLAYLVLEKGVPLSEIEYIDGITITRELHGIQQEIILPYRYPIINGKPFFSEELRKLLEKGIDYEENIILK